MQKDEWTTTWVRLKDRYPEWIPKKTEAEDFCMGLRVYPYEMVEKVAFWVSQNYSSKTPKLAWYIRKCETLKKEKIPQKLDTSAEDRRKELDDFDNKKEEALERLIGTDVTDLRKAFSVVRDQYGHLVSVPDNGDVKTWKNTFRSLVYLEIYGDSR